MDRHRSAAVRTSGREFPPPHALALLHLYASGRRRRLPGGLDERACASVSAVSALWVPHAAQLNRLVGRGAVALGRDRSVCVHHD